MIELCLAALALVIFGSLGQLAIDLWTQQPARAARWGPWCCAAIAVVGLVGAAELGRSHGTAAETLLGYGGRASRDAWLGLAVVQGLAAWVGMQVLRQPGCVGGAGMALVAVSLANIFARLADDWRVMFAAWMLIDFVDFVLTGHSGRAGMARRRLATRVCSQVLLLIAMGLLALVWGGEAPRWSHFAEAEWQELLQQNSASITLAGHFLLLGLGARMLAFPWSFWSGDLHDLPAEFGLLRILGLFGPASLMLIEWTAALSGEAVLSDFALGLGCLSVLTAGWQLWATRQAPALPATLAMFYAGWVSIAASRQTPPLLNTARGLLFASLFLAAIAVVLPGRQYAAQGLRRVLLLGALAAAPFTGVALCIIDVSTAFYTPLFVARTPLELDPALIVALGQPLEGATPIDWREPLLGGLSLLGVCLIAARLFRPSAATDNNAEILEPQGWLTGEVLAWLAAMLPLLWLVPEWTARQAASSDWSWPTLVAAVLTVLAFGVGAVAARPLSPRRGSLWQNLGESGLHAEVWVLLGLSLPLRSAAQFLRFCEWLFLEGSCEATWRGMRHGLAQQARSLQSGEPELTLWFAIVSLLAIVGGTGYVLVP